MLSHATLRPIGTPNRCGGPTRTSEGDSDGASITATLDDTEPAPALFLQLDDAIYGFCWCAVPVVVELLDHALVSRQHLVPIVLGVVARVALEIRLHRKVCTRARGVAEPVGDLLIGVPTHRKIGRLILAHLRFQSAFAHYR